MSDLQAINPPFGFGLNKAMEGQSSLKFYSLGLRSQRPYDNRGKGRGRGDPAPANSIYIGQIGFNPSDSVRLSPVLCNTYKGVQGGIMKT
jgi:hypothetical protein